jgi:hypothetical protein
LSKYGGDGVARYKRAIVDNTKRFYKDLPTEMKDFPDNPISFAKLEDPEGVFLHVQSSSKDILSSIEARFAEYCKKENLPYSNRASFGFPTSNWINVFQNGHRLTIGIDDPKVLKKQAKFFRELQDCIDSIPDKNSKSKSDIEDEFLKKIKKNKCIQ